MKKLILLSVTLLASAYASAQNPTDDIYYSSKDKGAQQQAPPVSNFKNGAKEIIYVDKDIDIDKMAAKPLQTGPADSKKDSVRQPAAIYQSNVPADSVYSNDEGYYLNGFNGSKSDFDYAELMRMNYNRKYCIPYYDPRFNDIYMLNSTDWNVYIDNSGNYAWVTPTWSNPMWFDYFYRPFSYPGYLGFGMGYDYPSWGYYSYYNSLNWPYYNYGYGGYYSYYDYDYGYWGGYDRWNRANNRNHYDRLSNGVSSRYRSYGIDNVASSGVNSSRGVSSRFTVVDRTTVSRSAGSLSSSRSVRGASADISAGRTYNTGGSVRNASPGLTAGSSRGTISTQPRSSSTVTTTTPASSGRSVTTSRGTGISTRSSYTPSSSTSRSSSNTGNVERSTNSNNSSGRSSSYSPSNSSSGSSSSSRSSGGSSSSGGGSSSRSSGGGGGRR